VVERRAVVDEDEPFLRALFASTRPEVADWPEPAREAFLAQQFAAQRAGWSEMFPGSAHELILFRGEPAGRVWVHRTEEDCLVVDIALVPERRRQGIGTEVVQEILAVSDRDGVPTRAHVERTNLPSLAFWSRLGFRETAGDALFIEITRAVGGGGD
jgi:GNAT superfamily N-acetyltransferase